MRYLYRPSSDVLRIARSGKGHRGAPDFKARAELGSHLRNYPLAANDCLTHVYDALINVTEAPKHTNVTSRLRVNSIHVHLCSLAIHMYV